MLVPTAPVARVVWLPGGATFVTVRRVPTRTPLPPFPVDDDPTDEVPPFERAMRKHASSAEPELTIEEEIEREGIEDRDPFELFDAVPERELTDPGFLSPEEEALPELDPEALVGVDEPEPRPHGRSPKR